MNEENHMVQPYADDEPFPSRNEPDGDDLRETLADIGAGFSEAHLKDNERSLEDKIRDLLFEIAATDRVPHYATVSILKECLDHLDKDKVRVASLADDFDAAAKRIESSLMMGRKQA